MDPQIQPLPSLLDDGITREGASFLVVVVVLTFVASVFVVPRFMQRRRSSVKWDDWACLGLPGIIDRRIWLLDLYRVDGHHWKGRQPYRAVPE